MNKMIARIGLLLVVAFLLAPAVVLAADEAGAPGAGEKPAALPGLGAGLAGLGAALGAGLVAIGAGYGIGRFTAALADGIARQPSAANTIIGAVNLPLFLLEGVSIIGLVVCLLVVFVRK